MYILRNYFFSEYHHFHPVCHGVVVLYTVEYNIHRLVLQGLLLIAGKNVILSNKCSVIIEVLMKEEEGEEEKWGIAISAHRSLVRILPYLK